MPRIRPLNGLKNKGRYILAASILSFLAIDAGLAHMILGDQIRPILSSPKSQVLGVREIMESTNDNPYDLRYQNHLQGGMRFIGNTLGLSMSSQTAADFQVDTWAADSVNVFISPDQQANVPGYPAGTTRDWRQNGSSSQLNLPQSSDIVYALLMWGGNYKHGNKPENDVSQHINDPIRFSTPKGSYEVAPDPKYTYLGSGQGQAQNSYFQSAEVTEYLRQSPNGTYSIQRVPGVVSQEGLENRNTPDNYIGWTMAVVYKNPAQPHRAISLFTGLQPVSPSTPTTDVVLDGFATPTRDQPQKIKGKLFVSAAEGDADLTGDRLLFGADPNQLKPLSGPRNPQDNFFASQINKYDSSTDTDGSFGDQNNPLDTSQFSKRQGWDITTVDISNQLTHDQTSAIARGTSDSDGYRINMLGMEIDLHAPNLVLQTSVDKTTTNLEDILTYTIDIENTGDNAALDTTLTNLIPKDTEFLPASLRLDSNSLDQDPTDQVKLPDIPASGKHRLTFQVRVKSVPQDRTIKNQVALAYKYQLTSQDRLYSQTLTSQELRSTIPDNSQTPQTQPPLPPTRGPQANPDTANTRAGQVLIIDVTQNDSTRPNTSIRLVQNPTHGTASIVDGKIRYQPKDGYQGNDSLIYEICDSFGQCSQAEVNLKVQPKGQVLGVSDSKTNSVLPRSGATYLFWFLLTSILAVVIGSMVSGIGLMEKDDSDHRRGEY